MKRLRQRCHHLFGEVFNPLNPCNPWSNLPQITPATSESGLNRFPFPPRLWITALFACSLASCGLFKSTKTEDPEKKPKADLPKLVGRIASIPADKRFVLIQSYGKWHIETGTILTTRGENDRTANLLVTGESLGQFAAADLKSGSLDVGDAVYSRHVPQPTEPSEAPKPPSPSPEPVLELPE